MWTLLAGLIFSNGSIDISVMLCPFKLKCAPAAVSRFLFIGDGEPGITYLGITESGITESGITWVIGIKHNRNWYN